MLEQKKVEYHASIERTKELEKLSLLEQKKTREDKQRQARLIALKVILLLSLSSNSITLIHQDAQQRRKQQYENHLKIDERRPSTPNQRPTSARQKSNPSPAPLPPPAYVDEVQIELSFSTLISDVSSSSK